MKITLINKDNEIIRATISISYCEYVDLDDLIQSNVPAGNYQILIDDGIAYGTYTYTTNGGGADSEYDSLASEINTLIEKLFNGHIYNYMLSEIFQLGDNDLSIIANECYTVHNIEEYINNVDSNDDIIADYIKPFLFNNAKQFLKFVDDENIKFLSDDEILVLH